MEKNSSLPKWGGRIIIAAFIYLACTFMWHSVPLNLATWVLWALLDTLIARWMKKGKNSGYSVMRAFAIGASIIACLTVIQIIMGKTTLTWGTKETITATCFMLALAIRQISASDNLTINMGTTAMLIAGIPTLLDVWKDSTGQDPYFWSANTLGCVVMLLGAPKGFTNRYLPVGGTILNGSIAALAMGLKHAF